MEILVVLTVIIGLWALVVVSLLAFTLITYIAVGARVLFEHAADQGFIGLAAYVACWVFLFPIMLVASIAIGIANVHFLEHLMRARLIEDDRRLEEQHRRASHH